MRSLSNEHQGDEHELVAEISRLKSENRKLTDLLAIVMSKNLSELKQQRRSKEEDNSRKRKRDDENRENISSVYVRIDPSDDSMSTT